MGKWDAPPAIISSDTLNQHCLDSPHLHEETTWKKIHTYQYLKSCTFFLRHHMQLYLFSSILKLHIMAGNQRHFMFSFPCVLEVQEKVPSTEPPAQSEKYIIIFIWAWYPPSFDSLNDRWSMHVKLYLISCRTYIKEVLVESMVL